MNGHEHVLQAWHLVVLATTLVLALAAAGHALLYKRDSRAAVLWVALVWMLPLAGALLYFVFGINRIRRRAMLLRGGLDHYHTRPEGPEVSAGQLAGMLPPDRAHLASLAVAQSRVLSRPLLPGNSIEPLIDGDEAYPAMLEAIAGARQSITLCTYIFDRDETGLAFARALGAAVRRGVQVRVLVDATGVRYSWPSIMGVLRREGVPHARFLRTFPLRRLLEMNLRNHRKILVVDGTTGFTGGINIRQGHWLDRRPAHPVRDLHFRVRGPVVAHMQEAFADDWFFTTREALRGPAWFPASGPCGTGIARGISDGPDEDFEKLRCTLLGALAAARRSVRILTPYFLPEQAVVASLNLAALRGVDVDILLPSRSNLPFVQWASTAHWWQVLERGCHIWLSPPPFDHSKLMVVDEAWVLLGSTNWDPRSLRLNFEFNIECYDPVLGAAMAACFDGRLRKARQTSLQEVDARSIPVRLRDGAARLFTPFL